MVRSQLFGLDSGGQDPSRSPALEGPVHVEVVGPLLGLVRGIGETAPDPVQGHPDGIVVGVIRRTLGSDGETGRSEHRVEVGPVRPLAQRQDSPSAPADSETVRRRPGPLRQLDLILQN